MATRIRQQASIRRPFAGIAISFAAGIWLGAQLRPGVTIAGLAALAVIAVTFFLAARYPRLGFFATLAAVSLSGMFLHEARTVGHSESPDFPKDSGAVTRVKGLVRDLPETRRLERPDLVNGRLLRFPVDMNEMLIDGKWTPVEGGLLVTAVEEDSADSDTPALARLNYGDEVELALQISPPPRPTNPGEFDYGGYLMYRQGTYALGRTPALISVKPGSRFSFRRLTGETRRGMRDYIESKLPADRAALLRCVLLGERYALAPEQLNAYMLSGAVHFLVVSGLHVGLLALAVWYILIPAGVGPRLSAIFVMLVVIFYAVLAGLRPPVFRAAVMTTVFCGGHIIRRRPDPLNSICLAALVLMLINPTDLFDGGFIMSFTAVAGIILFTGPIYQFLFGPRDIFEESEPAANPSPPRRAIDYAKRGVSVSLAAWISVAPLAVYYFNTVTPATFIFNLAAAPIISGMLAVGFPAAALGPLIGGYVEPLILAAGALAGLLEWMVSVFSRTPGVRFFVGDVSIFAVIVFYVFLAIFAARRRIGFGSARLGTCGLLAASVLVWGAAFHHDTRPSFSVMDVGNGLATLLQLPGGVNVMYDCGGASGSGEWVMAPFLHSRGVSRLDAIIISHPHDDHWNGLETLLERFSVGKIILPRGFGNMDGGRELLALMRRHRLPAYTKAAGDALTDGDEIKFEALHPPPSNEWIERLSANDASLVMRFSGAGFSILLTGDIEEPGIAMMVNSDADMRSDIMLAPHHGRSADNIEMLLEAASPDIVISSGGSVDERYRSGDWQLFDTTELGALKLVFAPGSSPEIFAGADMSPATLGK